MNISIIGATGAVGQQILELLSQRRFPLRQLRCFASPQSAGKTIRFQNQDILLETLHPGCFSQTDLAFFCAGSSISKAWIPEAKSAKAFIIDSSSALRMLTEVPLIIPEINAHAIHRHQGIVASPNCAATILLMPLFSLHRLYRAKRIVTSTYQAASGAGAHLLRELQAETRAFLDNRPYPHLLPHPYAFNLYPHNSALRENGYVEEEIKMAEETRKILEDETIQVSATCVRVPVLRAHSVSANVEFHSPFSLEEVYEALQKVPGLKVFEDRAQNRFATPVDVTGKDEVYCGRFRIDPTQPNTLEFWAVGDQLLKGAALNAVQIGELFYANGAGDSKRSSSFVTG
jgi:aspartate-semialdehyde dehydrogenase